MLGSPRLLSASALTSSTSHCSQHKLFKSHFKAQPGNPSPPGVHITFQNGLIILGTGAYLITAALQKGFQKVWGRRCMHTLTHTSHPRTLTSKYSFLTPTDKLHLTQGHYHNIDSSCSQVLSVFQTRAHTSPFFCPTVCWLGPPFSVGSSLERPWKRFWSNLIRGAK